MELSYKKEPELQELIKLVECTVCCSIPKAPIFNCTNGHFICVKCSDKMCSQICAYCRGRMTYIRNLPLEAILASKTFRCDFNKYGCRQGLMTLDEYEIHVRCCPKKVVREKIREYQLQQNLINPEIKLCPKCNQQNEAGKIKCQNCQFTLRVPTPMFLSYITE